MNQVTNFGGGFKASSIEAIITKKINHWLKTIQAVDSDLAQSVKDCYFVTGGAITSMLLGEKPNDFDVYLSDPKVAQKLVEYYLKDIVASKYVSKVEARIVNDNQVAIFLKSIGVVSGDYDEENDEYRYFESEPLEVLDEYINRSRLKANEEKPYTVKLITSNAITLNDDIQIITRFVGNPEEIHENFDFIHTTNYFSSKTGLVLNLPALQATIAKELKYKGTKYPLATMFRLRKFIQRGWRITAGELVKIGYDVSKLNLDDVNVLKEQLIGVDIAYFHEVITILRQNSTLTDAETLAVYQKPIDRTYLFDILEQVFDSVDDNWISTGKVASGEPVMYNFEDGE